MKTLTFKSLTLILAFWSIFLFNIQAQTFCPNDAPTTFEVEETNGKCYLVIVWPEDQMPKITCGNPGTPAPGSGEFEGKLIDSEVEIDGVSTVLYNNGNSSDCNNATMGIEYHPTIPNAYRTIADDYCEALDNEFIFFEMNRTSGSNFFCDIKSTSALPVELTYFMGSETKADILLQWGTAVELNNKAFYIEYSTDGRKFNEAGYVEGAGNSHNLQHYTFLHKEAVRGINYYRLRQVDFDGHTAYSEIISVKFEGYNNGTVIYPTLASNEINIKFEERLSEDMEVEVFDLLGHKLTSTFATAGSTTLKINITTLTQGHYFIKTGTIDDIKTNRFIKI